MSGAAQQESSTDVASPFWRTNRGIGVGLTVGLLLLLIQLITSDWVYEELRDGFHLGSVPVASVVAMLACTVVLIFDQFRNLMPQRLAEARRRDWLYACLLTLACWLLFEFARLTSTLIAAPIFLAALSYFLGARPLSLVVISAVAMGGGVYTLFRLLGIELPGALPF